MSRSTFSSILVKTSSLPVIFTVPVTKMAVSLGTGVAPGTGVETDGTLVVGSVSLAPVESAGTSVADGTYGGSEVTSARTMGV